MLGVALAAAAGAAQQPKAQLKYTLQRGDSSDLTIALPTAAFSPVRWIQRAWEGVFDATAGLPAEEVTAVRLDLLARLPLGPTGPVAGDWQRWVDWATTTLTDLCGHRLPRQQPAAQPQGARVLLLAECDKERVDLLSASISCRSRKVRWRRGPRSSLLLQSCSEWRRSARSLLPPLQLYDGLLQTNQVRRGACRRRLRLAPPSCALLPPWLPYTLG